MLNVWSDLIHICIGTHPRSPGFILQTTDVSALTSSAYSDYTVLIHDVSNRLHSVITDDGRSKRRNFCFCKINPGERGCVIMVHPGYEVFA